MTSITLELIFFTACGADITERKSFTETMHKHIKDLEEEITVMQNTVKQIKDNAKRLDPSEWGLSQVIIFQMESDMRLEDFQ
jgi:hypothetical protein